MTGRGLLLVDSLSDEWGVEPRNTGKSVWAVVSRHEKSATADRSAPGGSGDRARSGSLPQPSLASSSEPHYRIKLGRVPTDLLIAAKTHVDNVLREFTLATRGAASGLTADIPPNLASLIERVTGNFAEARNAIKVQASAAQAAGDAHTELVLGLPLSAADTGREYLAALDEVDKYARAARLLTLETPPQHRAFRRWYVAELTKQVDAYRRQEHPAPPRPFEQFLLDELDIVAAAHRATDRAARLQKVSSSLAGAATVEEVAKVVVSQGVEALGATGGALMIPNDAGGLDVVSSVNYSKTLERMLEGAGVRARLPAATALRVGTAFWLESPDQIHRLFPDFHDLEPNTVSMCAVPIALGDDVLGALRLSFDSPRLFDSDERSFFLAFVAQAAQALGRSRLYASEQRARARAEDIARQLRRINRVTAALARSHDVTGISRIVTVEAHRALGAAVTALCLLEGDTTLRTVAIQGSTQREAGSLGRPSPSTPISPSAKRYGSTDPSSSNPGLSFRGAVSRPLTGHAPHDHSVLCVPLSTERGPLGALSVSFHPDAVDPGLIETLTTSPASARSPLTGPSSWPVNPSPTSRRGARRRRRACWCWCWCWCGSSSARTAAVWAVTSPRCCSRTALSAFRGLGQARPGSPGDRVVAAQQETGRQSADRGAADPAGCERPSLRLADGGGHREVLLMDGVPMLASFGRVGARTARARPP